MYIGERNKKRKREKRERRKGEVERWSIILVPTSYSHLKIRHLSIILEILNKRYEDLCKINSATLFSL